MNEGNALHADRKLGAFRRGAAASLKPCRTMQEPRHLLSMPAILQNVTFSPELNAQMPLLAAFTDESGKSVSALGQYFHQRKPVLLAFVYYGCPMLCTQLEQGVVGSAAYTFRSIRARLRCLRVHQL